MGASGPRADSRARAERALRLRCRGHTWQEIADAEGFKSRSSATLAVKRLILREPPEDVITSRTYTAGAYRLVTATLFESLAEAKAKPDNHEAVVSISRAIAYVQDKHAALTGQKVVVAQEINVQVTSSATAVIDQAEKDLLAIASGHRDAGLLPVIDAELVDAP